MRQLLFVHNLPDSVSPISFWPWQLLLWVRVGINQQKAAPKKRDFGKEGKAPKTKKKALLKRAWLFNASFMQVFEQTTIESQLPKKTQRFFFTRIFAAMIQGLFAQSQPQFKVLGYIIKLLLY